MPVGEVALVRLLDPHLQPLALIRILDVHVSTRCSALGLRRTWTIWSGGALVAEDVVDMDRPIMSASVKPGSWDRGGVLARGLRSSGSRLASSDRARDRRGLASWCAANRGRPLQVCGRAARTGAPPIVAVAVRVGIFARDLDRAFARAHSAADVVEDDLGLSSVGKNCARKIDRFG